MPATPKAQASPTPPLTQRRTADQPDDYDGYQVHFLYVLPSDGVDDQLETNGWMTTAIGSALRWFEKEAGGRRLSVDMFRGELDITFVRLSRTDAVVAAYDSFDRASGRREPLVRTTLEVELRALGFQHPRKLYAVYYGGGSDSGECFGGAVSIGIANVKRGTRCEEAQNLIYPDGTYAITTANFHELFHALGAVAECAPHHGRRAASGDYEGIPGVRWTPKHVADDPLDLMYPKGSRTQPPRFDAGRDDYFGHGKPDCLDLARSPFVLPVAPNPELPPLWPVAAARLRACEDEPTAGATGTGTPAEIIFDNMRDATAQVFQLTPQGRILRDTVRPWIASRRLGTQAGSAWLVADASGNCLAIFVAEASLTRASVRQGPTPTAPTSTPVPALTRPQTPVPTRTPTATQVPTPAPSPQTLPGPIVWTAPARAVHCTVNEVANTVTYGEDGRLSGAFYRPSGAGPFPAVLVLHTSGGFNAHVRSAATLLSARGFVTLVPDYLTPLGVSGGTTESRSRSFLPLHTDGAREVMAQALECLKVQPFVDPQRLGAVGFSLGGYFAFILATRSDIKGVVSYYGAYHGAPVSSIPTPYSWRDIVSQVLAPALILHGDSDSTIPLFRAEGVRRLMEERSKAVEMDVYPGVEHAFDQVGAPTYNASVTADALARTLTFLNAKLR